MKKTLLILAAMSLFVFGVNAQTKKDGTPDMRYKANKQTYSTPRSSTPKTTTPRNYNNGGQYRVQKGYQKSNGTYVAPHIKTTPDNKKWNNANPKN